MFVGIELHLSIRARAEKAKYINYTTCSVFSLNMSYYHYVTSAKTCNLDLPIKHQ